MLKFNRKFLVLPIMICLMLATLCTFGFAGCSSDKLTVTFDAGDGYFVVQGKTQKQFKVEVESGKKIDPKTILLPERASDLRNTYTFDGWDYNISDKAITESITINAQWQKADRKYTVTFDARGGKFDSGASVISGEYKYEETIKKPANPTKDSDGKFTYTFAGWDKTVSEKVTGDVTYNAKWSSTENKYTITFNLNGGSVQVGEQSLTKYVNNAMKFGETVKLPDGYTINAKESTQASEYEFAGWFNAEVGGEEVKTVSATTTVYAHWTEKPRMYTITFDAGAGEFTGGAKTVAVSLTYGSKIETTLKPTRASDNTSNYTFTGFNIGADAKVESDATYTAQYSVSTRYYTITFNAGTIEGQNGYFVNPGTKTYTKSDYTYGAIITAPEGLTMASTVAYTFTSGGYDNGFVSGTTTVDGDATYTAQWTTADREYVVTFYAGDGAKFSNGENMITTKLVYNTVVTVPETAKNPQKDSTIDRSYTFTGSDTSTGYVFVDKKDKPLTSDVKVTGDMSFTATYTESTRVYTVTFNAGDGVFADGKKEVTQQVKYGEKPVMEGFVYPTQDADTYATYEFKDWGKDVVAVDGTDNTLSYTAQYTATAKTYTATFRTSRTGGTLVKMYTFKASKGSAPTLTDAEYAELEKACREIIGEGFAGKLNLQLHNYSEVFYIDEGNVYEYGNGMKNNPYLINDLDSFKAMLKKLDGYYQTYSKGNSLMQTTTLMQASNTYYKMIADVDFLGYTDNSQNWFIGHLDAQKNDTENYAIKGMTAEMFSNRYGAMFAKLWNAEISNLDIVLGESIVNFGERAYGTSVTFKNVNVKNADSIQQTFITADDTNECAYVCFSVADALTFEDCTNYANYSASAYFGIFLGGFTGSNNTVTTCHKLTFTRCENYGDVFSSNWVGMLLGNPCARNFAYDVNATDPTSNEITITNCANYGSITATQYGGCVATSGKGFTAEQVTALNKLVPNATKGDKTGSFTPITKLAGKLSTDNNKFTLTNSSSNYKAGTYVITLTKYAVAKDGSTVRVNYSYTKELTAEANSIEFGGRYDFIDLESYNALTGITQVTFNDDDWKTTVGYEDIKYAFDGTNHYVVFDFDEFGTDYTLSSGVYTADITYYVDGTLTGVVSSKISAYKY